MIYFINLFLVLTKYCKLVNMTLKTISLFPVRCMTFLLQITYTPRVINAKYWSLNRNLSTKDRLPKTALRASVLFPSWGRIQEKQAWESSPHFFRLHGFFFKEGTRDATRAALGAAEGELRGTPKWVLRPESQQGVKPRFTREKGKKKKQ